MEKLKMLIGMAAFGVLAFTGDRLAAFPLTLTSVNGTITFTHTYGADATTTSNLAAKVSVNLSHVITVLSNEVFLDLGTHPADLRIALDLYTGGLYLTNSSGFSYDLEQKGLGNFRIREIATTFSTTGVAEQDVMLVDLSFNGREPNGQSFDFNLRGYATFKLRSNSTGGRTISLSATKASGYGEVNSSDSGVSQGGFRAQGSGTPEWTGPFSVFWWNF